MGSEFNSPPRHHSSYFSYDFTYRREHLTQGSRGAKEAFLRNFVAKKEAGRETGPFSFLTFVDTVRT